MASVIEENEGRGDNLKGRNLEGYNNNSGLAAQNDFPTHKESQ